MAAVQISHLSVERYTPPYFIHHSTPRISWRFSSPSSTKDWVQLSYTAKLIHDDGTTEEHTVKNDQNVLVEWPFKPLSSKQSVQLSVKASGSDGSSTDYKSITLDTGLLHPSEWVGQMISGEAQPKDAPKRPFVFQSPTINLSAPPKRARMYITAHGVYTPYLNALPISDQVLAPGWQSYHHRLHYQVYDITDKLKVGENNVGVVVGEGWYAGRLGFGGGVRNIYGDDMGLLCQIEIDGTVHHSNTDWQFSYGPILTSEIYDGEVFDSRLIKSQWSGPWKSTRAIESPKGELILPEAPPVRRTQEIKAIEKIITPSGKIIFDFGQNLVGWLKIDEQPSTKEGEKIVFAHAEVLENGELGVRPLRAAKCQDHIICGGDLVGWEPSFTFHGFRYAQVEGWKDVNMDSVTAIVIHSDMEKLGHFECSHKLLNQLHSNVTWGLRGNFVSVPTDCPQRDERLGWTGDLQAFAPTASFLYDVSGLLGDWLQDLSKEQATYKGVPPVVVPDVLQFMGPPMAAAVWGDVAAITPMDLYKAYGDERILRDQYKSMITWLDEGVIREKDTRLWGRESFQFGDWLDPKAPPDAPGDGRTNNQLVASAYLVHVTKIVAEVSKVLGERVNANRYLEEYQALRKAFQNEYVTPIGRMMSDSQTAFALALRFDLLEESQKPMALERLSFLIRNGRFQIGTGFAGTPIIVSTLADNGMLSMAYRMLQEKGCPSWLYPVTMGATTIWERWDSMLPDGTINPGEMTSFNHYALGAVATFMHEYIGGISPASPGWKKSIIRPRPGGTVKSARVSHISPYGEVACEWEIQGDKLKVQVTVPPNTTADVILPGVEETVGSGKRSYEVDWKDDPTWPPKLIQPLFPGPVPDEYAE